MNQKDKIIIGEAASSGGRRTILIKGNQIIFSI